MSNIINNWEEIPEYRAREVEWPIVFHKYELSEKLLDEFLTMAELATKNNYPHSSLLVSKFFIHTKDNKNQLEDLNLRNSCKIIAQQQQFSENLLIKHYDSLSFTDLYHNKKLQETWDDLESIHSFAHKAHLLRKKELDKIFWDSINMNPNLDGYLSNPNLIIGEDMVLDYSEQWIHSDKDRNIFLKKVLCSSKTIEMVYNSYSNEDSKSFAMKCIIPTSQILDQDFMDRYINELSIDNICLYQTNISEEFFDKHINLLKESPYFYMVFKNNEYSEDFLDKHSEHFDQNCWDRISENQKLSPVFIQKYYDKLNPFCLSQNRKLNYSKNEIRELLESGKEAAPKSLKVFKDALTAEMFNSIKYSGLKEILNVLDSLKEASKAICNKPEKNLQKFDNTK